MTRLFLAALPLIVSGCASDVSPDDRDFFYRGWTHPEQAAQERMNGRKHASIADPDAAMRHPMPVADSSN